MGAYSIKSLSLKQFDLSEQQILDHWLSYSVSTNSQFLRDQFVNVRRAIKHGRLEYKGKRLFIALCCGQVSKYIKWKHIEGTPCEECEGIITTSRAL